MDMNRSLNKRAELAIAIALMTVGSAAIAGPASEWRYIGDFQPTASTAGLSTTPFQSASGLGTNFGSSEWGSGSSSSAAALTLEAQTAAASTDDSSGQRMRALSASTTTSNTSPVVGSPAALDLTLWNFITNIRAQQVSDPFVQLQTSAANIDYTINGVPAPVPLPPAFWLFGAGLAALAVGRFMPRKLHAVDRIRTLSMA